MGVTDLDETYLVIDKVVSSYNSDWVKIMEILELRENIQNCLDIFLDKNDQLPRDFLEVMLPKSCLPEDFSLDDFLLGQKSVRDSCLRIIRDKKHDKTSPPRRRSTGRYICVSEIHGATSITPYGQ